MKHSSTERTWVIAGGGTGGHVMPALALGEELVRQNQHVLFVGAEGGLENRLVPEAGFPLECLRVKPFMGKNVFQKILAALQLIPATWRAIRILRDTRAKLVISVGGYAAVPCILAATILRRRLALVEPNAIPGRVTRLAAHVADHIFLGFEAAVARLGATRAEVHVTGIPVRQSLRERCALAREVSPPGKPLHLLIFGGSQGARQLNDAMLDALPHLDRSSLSIFHQTGTADVERVCHAYADFGVEAEVVAFEANMPERYRWADLALCRAGALTVAELTLAQLPALLVPYPFAADDHQRANALEFMKGGAGIVLSSEQLHGEALAQIIESFYHDSAKRVRMGRKAGELAHPDAVTRILGICRRGLGEMLHAPMVTKQRTPQPSMAVRVQE